MLWHPRQGGVRYEHNFGTVGSLTPGTSVTTGAAAATKGTPVELIASTNFDAFWIRITAGNYGASATTARGCLDILVGAATEEVLIPNLLMGFCGSTGGANPGLKTWEFPLYIPAGTRIAAQVAGDRTSTAMRVGVQLYGGGDYPAWRVGQRVTTYGIGTVPAATDFTPGASAAEGAWAAITASTTEDHFCVVPSAQPPTGDTTLTASALFLDIGIGAATEELLFGDSTQQQSYIFSLDGAELVGGPANSFPCFGDVPSGSRLTMRGSRSSAADTVATWNGALHCVS